MIYSASSATIRRSARISFNGLRLSGQKQKRTYNLLGLAQQSFVDTFVRSDSGDLGKPIANWVETSGDWQINGNTAFTPTSASTYPIASFSSTSANGTFKAYNSGNTAGYGVAFWVEDSDNWWAATTDSTTTSTTSSGYTCPNGGTLSGTTCLKTCASTTTYYTGGTCPARPGDVFPDSNCICNDPGGCGCGPETIGVGSTQADCFCYWGYQGQTVYPPGVQFSCEYFGWYTLGWNGSVGDCYSNRQSGWVLPYTYTGSGCTLNSSTSYYNCDYPATFTSSTTTVYNHFVKLLKKTSGTVNELLTFTFSSSGSDVYINNLSVTTNGGNVTITANTGSTFVSQTYTDSGSVYYRNHGMAIAPASRSQASRIARYDYTR